MRGINLFGMAGDEDACNITCDYLCIDIRKDFGVIKCSTFDWYVKNERYM